MILCSKLEYRGSSIRKNEKGEYHFINLEDENGESSKFSINNDIVLSKFKKGDKLVVDFDFSIKYGSLKVVGVDINGKDKNM